MSIWLEGNPTKAVKSNWRRFIAGWLTRSQDKGGDIDSGFLPVIEQSKSKTPPWLPDNWRKLASLIVGPEALEYSCHTQVPRNDRCRFQQACRGEIPEEELANNTPIDPSTVNLRESLLNF